MADLPPPTSRRWPWRVGGLLVAVATLALMVATEPKLAIVWDEGFTLGREARIRDWFRAVARPKEFAARWVPPSPRSELVQDDGLRAPRADEVDTRAKLFSPKVIAWFWPFAREEPHGHPPFYAIEGLLGDWLAPDWPVLSRARLGPMVAFSLVGGAIFGFMARRWCRCSAILATAAWVFQPNLFGHGHYATVDGLLTSLWVGAILAFALAVEREGRSPRWAWVVVFGVLCGWAADSKLTGWFLPLPFFAWSLLYRDRRGWMTILVGGIVAVLVLFAFNPCWWNDPASGVIRFFRSNLTRGKSIPIPIQFFGTIYNTPKESLPWFNTLAWTVLVTPVGFLVLGVVGAGLGFWRTVLAVRRPPTPALPREGGGDQTGGGNQKKESKKGAKSATLPPSPLVGEGRGGGAPHDPQTREIFLGPFASLVTLHWSFLLALRALPNTPGHDGVRLFLPAFGVLALVAGVGASVVVRKFGRWGTILVVAAVAEGIASVALMMPVPLAYFSPVVGGLPGAAKLGMEPTYFWDSLSGEAIDWLNANTPEGRSVRFATYPTSWLYLRQAGRLKVPVAGYEQIKPKWLVVQNRPSAYGSPEPEIRELVANGKPAFVVRKFGVPLVLIYPYPD